MNEQISYFPEEKSTNTDVPKRTFSTVETVFAWLCFAIGYGFCKVFPSVLNPFGAFIFTVALFVTSVIVVKIRGAAFKLTPCIVAVSALLMSLSMIFTSNGVIQFFAYVYCLLSYGYFMYTAFENQTEGGFSDLILIDFFKVLFIVPFISFAHIYQAAFSGKKGGKGKLIVKIIIGIAIAVIPTAIIIALLSYDSNFSAIIDSIFAEWNIFNDIVCLLLGVPVGMYAYGIFVSSVDRKCKNIMTAEDCHNTSLKAKKAPISTILAATLPILAVYVIFFISQWQYYISGFKGILPKETIYADYAREGFFQLCAVAVINFVIIIVVSLFMRRKTENPTIVQKVLTIVFSVFTLILIATAISKMVMYIDVYGLTPKRVYATWFMLVLAIIFVLLIIKQFVSRIKVVVFSVLVGVVSFGTLAFSNVDGVIADYNVDRYFEDNTLRLDTDTLCDMGESAIPAMVRLVKYFDRMNGTDFLDYYNRSANIRSGLLANVDNPDYRQLCYYLFEMAEERNSETSLWDMTIPGIKADAALEESGLAENVSSVGRDFEVIAEVVSSYYLENHEDDGKILLFIYGSEILYQDEVVPLTDDELTCLRNVNNEYTDSYKYIDVSRDYVIFWNGETRDRGLVYAEDPLKVFEMLQDNNEYLEYEKINAHWYEVEGY